MSYNTKQKELIIKVIKDYNKEFTVKDIYNSLDKKIGLTTIYRLVDKMVIEGLINKSIGTDNNTYYQYLDECNNYNHFYLKCNNCGKIEHIDCDCIIELWEHLYNSHKFVPNKEKTIITGLCGKCNKKEVKTC